MSNFPRWGLGPPDDPPPPPLGLPVTTLTIEYDVPVETKQSDVTLPCYMCIVFMWNQLLHDEVLHRGSTVPLLAVRVGFHVVLPQSSYPEDIWRMVFLFVG